MLIFFLLMILTLTPVFAETAETLEASSIVTIEAKVPDFYQEFDITFWQTLPFAALWGHFIDRQLSSFMFPGSAAHWNVIAAFATVVSAGNAFVHSRRVIGNERTRDRH